jgi:hypothetical protein
MKMQSGFITSTCAHSPLLFYSLEMLQDYLTYFSHDIKPSSRRRCLWVSGLMEQSKFARLPLYLWEEPKRVKVVKALTEALRHFK